MALLGTGLLSLAVERWSHKEGTQAKEGSWERKRATCRHMVKVSPYTPEITKVISPFGGCAS